MLNMFTFFQNENVLWKKILTISFILFFIFLADAILSAWVPGLIENSFNSPVVMGFIISFSSIVGLGANLIFPQLLKGINFKKLLFLGVIISIVFSFSLIFASSAPYVLVFLASMAIWGVYYDVLGFANHQFVADMIPMRMHTSVWAFTGIFKNLAYFLGPLITGLLVGKGLHLPVYFAVIFSLIAIVILILSKGHHDRPVTIDIEKISFICEIEHWRTLFKRVWPLLVLSIFLGIIDAFFWTTGAVYTEELAQRSFLGSWFLPMYTLPSLFVGLIIVKKGIVAGKKKTALKFFLLSGLFLALMGVFDSVLWQLLAVFCSGLALSITYPLIDGVYSDIIVRMGKQRKHMMGLCFSTVSFSYVIGPILAGLISSVVGSVFTFVYLGLAIVTIAIVIMLVTPKKLKLPQAEIKKWVV